MAARAGQTGQAGVVAVHELDARALHTLDELAHARVAPGGVHVHLDHGRGRRLQADSHGVEAEQHFGGRRGSVHARIVATSISAPISTGWWTM